MTPSLEADRAELLDLLCRDGIYWSTPEHPIVTATGATARWMLDSMRVTLTARGAELAARCLLDRLARFDVETAQLATYGVTAIPLVDACVARGGDRYRGLIVRKEPKAWGSMKVIEGPLDPSTPIILVDDSISSGSSIARGLELLEAAGLYVLGAVCLVRFGWYGGAARMEAAGYQVEHVFDVNTDLVPRVEPTRPAWPYNPSTIVPPFTYADEAAPDGVHAATYAREVLAAALAGAPVRRPPARFDQPYDGAGGVWVSVRARANLQVRHARDGSWVFPSEAPRAVGTELVHAAVRTAALVQDPSLLAESAVAVTFFGALEEVTVGEVDHERHGIVVRSRERIERLGGALPRMPGMTRAWAQFEHARSKNAQLLPLEPYVLFRHTVTKAIEPGEAWQPTGVQVDRTPTWRDDPARAGRIAARALAIVRARLAGEPLAGEPLADPTLGPCEAIFVTIFADGRVAGCVGAKVATLDADLQEIAARALADTRFRAEPATAATARLAVSVSFLTDPVALGVLAPEEAAARLRLGEQAMTVFQDARAAVLLPFVALQLSYTREAFVAALIDKAGITRAPYGWGLFDCTSWLADDVGPRLLRSHLPPPEAPANDLAAGVARLTPLYLGYLRAHGGADGLRRGAYRPLTDTPLGEVEVARQLHGAWALAQAGAARADDELLALARLARDAARARLPAPGRVEDAFLLLASLALGDRGDGERAIAARLWAAIDLHGRIGWAPLPATGTAAEGELARRVRDGRQAYEPPQVLLALARATAAGVTAIDRAALDRALRACMHRFRGHRTWGQVSWLPMALAAWFELTGDATLAARAFEIIDWALTHQQVTTGGFINGEQADGPGCSTSVYLEGVAAALALAIAVHDHARVARYRDAAARAVDFLDTLTYQERDRPLLPDPARAIGGVRQSRTAGDVRIDFVQHALIAMLALATRSC